MKIEQIYTGCLAQGSYFISSNGEAAIIDPIRDTEHYLELAKVNGAKIKYIFETHFHADFVSGHLTLSEQTGAPIIYGPGAKTSFDIVSTTDGQIFELGEIKIKLLHTPGHTLESASYLVIDEKGKEKALFSGDALFLGDVGRPDLAQKGKDLTQEDLAGMLFDSLRNKIMPLPDDVIIYPGHGAGSACGKNMSKETVGILGEQKQTNYALRADMTKAEFISEVLDGLATPPDYFPEMVKLNREGYQPLDKIIEKSGKALSVEEFKEISTRKDVIILDVRPQEEFAKGFIPSSVFIGLNGSFAPWVGSVFGDINQNFVLVCPNGKEKEAITRLSRVGFDQTLGYLNGGFEAWKNANETTDSIPCISATDFADKWKNDGRKIIDVRKDTEYQTSHIKGAQCLPLDNIGKEYKDFPKSEPYYIHCAGGYRSLIACSLLKRHGQNNMINVDGGYGAIKQTNLELVD